MQSTTVLIFGLVFMATLYSTMGDNLQCMCSCCRGPNCAVEMLEPMFDLSPCTKDNCQSACPGHFQEKCGQADSTVVGECMGAMSASFIFNRYTTLGALILAITTIVMLRIR